MDLVVCQKGIELAKLIYAITRQLRSEERFGLISQMRRALASIPSNVAEGQARRTTGEFIQFVSHAEGSLAWIIHEPQPAVYQGTDLSVPQRGLAYFW
ncbi:MAG: four helix bundle protein [Acidobacteriota bacterium]|nr:four helix bundle protein [Acidobacteriota bacterium]